MTLPPSGLAGDPGPLGIYSDAAKRVSDTVNLHLLADREGNFGKWLAFRLSDGGTDGVLYDDVEVAADHQLHYRQCMYIAIAAGGMTPREASGMLTYFRMVYDAGNLPPALVNYHRSKLLRR